MAKSKRAKACDISQKVKNRVWERDEGCCIICGNPQAMPNSHYIKRSRGGLGVEQNIATMCMSCHHEYDNGSGEKHDYVKRKFKEYLVNYYPDWNEEDLYYKKEGNEV